MRIGVFCPNWVGDGVMALPFFNRLRAQNPNGDILAISKSWVAPIFQHHPNIDEIIALQKKDLSGFWATRNTGRSLNALDLDKIYLLSNSYRAAYLAKCSETPKRIGYKSQGRSTLLTHALKQPNENLHRNKYYLNLLGHEGSKYNVITEEGLNISSEETQWAKNELSKLNMYDCVAFFPFSVASSRTIPMSQAIEIIKEVKDSILIFGGKGDQFPGKEIEKILNSSRVKSIAGKYSLRESMAMIKECKGAIATDSGLGHISANLGVPTVSLFGAGDPKGTSPIGPRTSVMNAEVRCSPCLKNKCLNRIEPLLCIEKIDPTFVKTALNNLQY